MDVELIEIREFLAEHPPFDRLPEEVLNSLPAQLSIRYLRRGNMFPPVDEETPSLWLLRTGAVEFRDADKTLLERLSEGEYDAAPCHIGAALPGQNGRVIEDSLFYLLPCPALQQLRLQNPDFNHHFEQDLSARLQQAIGQLQKRQGGSSNLLHQQAGKLFKREPITITPEQSIHQAAELMSTQRASSLLIMEQGQLVGILTDRDLRQRCIAAGVDPAHPLSEIMTHAPQTLLDTAPAFEALIQMTRLHIHHMPVVNAQGKLKGIITASDILHQHNLNTVTLASTIRHCQDIACLAEASRQLPELQNQLISSGMGADQLTQALSAVSDGISQRLLELAEQQLGPAPVPYAWLVCGSQARREQTTVSDQDNALLLDDSAGPEHDGYFAKLAAFVSDGLASCGFVYCPGDVMATNPQWRQPRRVWREYFNLWINRPEPKALMHASIFFDMRPLRDEGKLFAPLQQEILQQCKSNTIFITHLVSNALSYRPPLGFFRQLVLIHDGEHNDTLDIKHKGVIPVVDLARVYALSAGLSAINTRERLLAAEAAGVLSHAGAQDLLHALEFIATLRARHQARQHADGLVMDNYLSPDSLSRPERAQLKDAFAIINTMQQAMEQRYQSNRVR